MAVSYRDRTSALAVRNKDANTKQQPAFVCNYNETINHKDIKEALDPPDPDIMPRISYRRKHNLATRIVRARLPGSEMPTKGQCTVSLTTGLGLNRRHSSAPCRKINSLCCTQMSAKESILQQRPHQPRDAMGPQSV